MVLAPLFTGLVFLVCVKTAQERKQKLKSIRQLIGIEKYFENTILQLKTRMEILSPKRFSQLSSEEQKNIPPPPPPATAPKANRKKSKQLKALENAVGPKYVELIVNNKNNDAVYNTTGVDTKPQFPGGTNFINLSLKFQNFGRSFKMKLKGKVHLKFTIERRKSF
jgi:hypothetical protein